MKNRIERFKQSYRESEREATLNAFASGEALRDGVTDFLKSRIEVNILNIFLWGFISLLFTIVFMRFDIVPSYACFAMFVGQWTAALWLLTIGMLEARRF